MRNYKKTALAVLGLSAALLGGGAHAGVVVDNGVVTATGTYVTYTFNEADLKLFGPVGGVSLSGDTLVFAPGNFSNSADGIVESTMQITVAAHSGYQLTSFGLTEGGSYTWGDAGVHLDVSGEFGVQDDDSPNDQFTPVSIMESDALVQGGAGDWTAGTGTVLPLASWGTVSSATLTITNALVVFDPAGGSSISKDFVNISAIATPVPEAETYAMLLAGLGLVGFMARRRGLSVI